MVSLLGPLISIAMANTPVQGIQTVPGPGPLQKPPTWPPFFWSLPSRIVFLKHSVHHVPSQQSPGPMSLALHPNPLQSGIPSTWHPLGKPAPDAPSRAHCCSSARSYRQPHRAPTHTALLISMPPLPLGCFLTSSIWKKTPRLQEQSRSPLLVKLALSPQRQADAFPPLHSLHTSSYTVGLSLSATRLGVL